MAKTEAEKALQSAESAHEKAEQREAEIRERCRELEGQVEELGERLRTAHEDSADLNAISEIRGERRAAQREAESLREELAIVADMVEDRRQAVNAAEIAVQLERAEGLQGAAEEIGANIAGLLDALAEEVEELEAVDNTMNRVRSRLQSLGHEKATADVGYGWQTAGLHGVRADVKDTRDAWQRHRRRERMAEAS